MTLLNIFANYAMIFYIAHSIRNFESAKKRPIRKKLDVLYKSNILANLLWIARGTLGGLPLFLAAIIAGSVTLVVIIAKHKEFFEID